MEQKIEEGGGLPRRRRRSRIETPAEWLLRATTGPQLHTSPRTIVQALCTHDRTRWGAVTALWASSPWCLTWFSLRRIQWDTHTNGAPQSQPSQRFFSRAAEQRVSLSSRPSSLRLLIHNGWVQRPSCIHNAPLKIANLFQLPLAWNSQQLAMSAECRSASSPSERLPGHRGEQEVQTTSKTGPLKTCNQLLSPN